MKGLITSVKRFSAHDGAGLRSTVFFKGCALRCVWCHNPETLLREKQLQFFKSKCVGCGACKQVCPTGLSGACSHCFACAGVCPTGARSVCGREVEADELVDELLADAPFFENGGGVTLSGGECMLQADFACALAQKLHARGVSVDIDTCGYAPQKGYAKILPFVDEFLFDLKAVDPAVHARCTGHTNERILDNLQFLFDRGARVEIRYPFVPDHNDGEVEKVGAYLRGTPITKIKVLGYHDAAHSKYASLGFPDTMPTVPLPTPKDLEDVVERLRAYGLNAVNGLKED